MAIASTSSSARSQSGRMMISIARLGLWLIRYRATLLPVWSTAVMIALPGLVPRTRNRSHR